MYRAEPFKSPAEKQYWKSVLSTKWGQANNPAKTNIHKTRPEIQLEASKIWIKPWTVNRTSDTFVIRASPKMGRRTTSVVTIFSWLSLLFLRTVFSQGELKLYMYDKLHDLSLFLQMKLFMILRYMRLETILKVRQNFFRNWQRVVLKIRKQNIVTWNYKWWRKFS